MIYDYFYLLLNEKIKKCIITFNNDNARLNKNCKKKNVLLFSSVYCKNCYSLIKFNYY